jgi:hypothetical protein
MDMDKIQINLNKTLNDFEAGLNIAGYFPIVSTFSGSLRISYGKLEIIGAIAVAALIAVRALFLTNDSDRNREFRKAVEVLIDYSLHGFANIMRGTIEVAPFVSLVTCLPYDLWGHRFAYPIQNHQSPENQLLFGEQLV